MDAKLLLEKILQSGRQLADSGRTYAEKGLDYAADKVGIPSEDGEQRDAMLAGLGKGAVVGGLAALLLGTRRGRSVTKSAVKVGSVAALGGLAYLAYKQWSEGQGTPAEPVSMDSVDEATANLRSRAVLVAMVGAAKADGQIDAEEQKKIMGQLEEDQLDQELTRFLTDEFSRPLNVDEIASHGHSPESAVEMYLGAFLVADEANEPEKTYLSQLASSLNLNPDLVGAIEKQAIAGG